MDDLVDLPRSRIWILRAIRGVEAFDAITDVSACARDRDDVVWPVTSARFPGQRRSPIAQKISLLHHVCRLAFERGHFFLRRRVRPPMAFV
jgi:hypothetical protein